MQPVGGQGKRGIGCLKDCQSTEFKGGGTTSPHLSISGQTKTWQKRSAFALLEMMHTSKYQTVWAALALILLATAQSASAFYIPGFTAVSYKDGQQVQLDVNKIFSKNAQLPYAYSELDFVCQPKGPVKRTWLNLGEILRGDRFVSSDFQVSSCHKVVLPTASIVVDIHQSMTAPNEARQRMPATLYESSIRCPSQQCETAH
jgi:hypothetical protein